MEKEYEVTFTAHHIINVDAKTEEEAREKAEDLFDGFCDWEMDVEEVVEEET